MIQTLWRKASLRAKGPVRRWLRRKYVEHYSPEFAADLKRIRAARH